MGEELSIMILKWDLLFTVLFRIKSSWIMKFYFYIRIITPIMDASMSETRVL